ncbi:hypothetical protein WH47_02309 [Habropoda laboriosa]|uniref:Uncharacterized protein n=1 Tax=Habropoda laboriosa TaxID=597456 RepID=A0A0L7QY82_9HYME|nr:hypothetical protein WH47_02309 [Habropoda laboriosa]
MKIDAWRRGCATSTRLSNANTGVAAYASDADGVRVIDIEGVSGRLIGVKEATKLHRAKRKKKKKRDQGREESPGLLHIHAGLKSVPGRRNECRGEKESKRGATSWIPRLFMTPEHEEKERERERERDVREEEEEEEEEEQGGSSYIQNLKSAGREKEVRTRKKRNKTVAEGQERKDGRVSRRRESSAREDHPQGRIMLGKMRLGHPLPRFLKPSHIDMTGVDEGQRGGETVKISV